LCTFTEYIYDFILVPTEELHPELDLAGLFGQTVADLVEGVHTLIIPKQDHLSIGVPKNSLFVYIMEEQSVRAQVLMSSLKYLRD
jgi:hypothetical protein